jgi:hypothetical protein
MSTAILATSASATGQIQPRDLGRPLFDGPWSVRRATLLKHTVLTAVKDVRWWIVQRRSVVALAGGRRCPCIWRREVCSSP